MKTKAFIKFLIKKINSLEKKSANNYSDNPFLKPYSSTLVWVDENNSKVGF